MFGLLKKIFGSSQQRKVKRYKNVVDQINKKEIELQKLTDQELKNKTEEFKQRLKKGETVDHLLIEAYAVVKNCCRRLVGQEIHVSGYNQKWDMIPYDVQIVGAIAMHRQSIAEMQTGEGKTLTAAMPLYLNALTQEPTHLVTVNDYLAQRDCEWIGTIFRWLGLTTSALTNQTPPSTRQEIYKADIVYGTASEFGFDYLRDNSMVMQAKDQVQRGHYFAIVDEVDSILIDEARTPLIISGPAPKSYQMYGDLKDAVALLVKKQRDLCNKLASEAKKVLDNKSSSNKEEINQALQTLWLISKGTPKSKILKRVLETPEHRTKIDEWDIYFHSEQNQKEKKTLTSKLFILVDEKGSDFELTDLGIQEWKVVNNSADDNEFLMLDLGYEYLKIDQDETLSEEDKIEKKLEIQKEDATRKEKAHNLRQLLRAQLLMERDVEYIVQDSKVIIIDENTGRPQPGRRFSDGLHQAIEAKEGVAIQEETQTYATITLQNYFRMYDKLAGMSGTVMTEAHEFKEIYSLDVLEVPTNKPCIRKDSNDEVYMTEREKYHAILKDVKEMHEKGRPILIGTDSVDTSEKLSRIFKQNRLTHTVLNAKHHEKEAEIISQAGAKKAITIATSMAGRGTDIKLQDGVKEVGGLYVLGTTRNQSRRIDRQLRGRCSRQGDPGSSKFYLSFEDPLFRFFSLPKKIIENMFSKEGESVNSSLLTSTISSAQQRVEKRHYTIRKHTLQYDDVMNKQRQEIYRFRSDILHAQDSKELAKEILESATLLITQSYCQGKKDHWDLKGLKEKLLETFPLSFDEISFENENKNIDAKTLEETIFHTVWSAFEEKINSEKGKIESVGESEEQSNGAIQEAIRSIITRKLDELWKEHLLKMDHLRSDVHLRAVGQKDPLMEFKHEGFKMFDELYQELNATIAQDLFKFQIVIKPPPTLEELFKEMAIQESRDAYDPIEEVDQTEQKSSQTEEKQPEKPSPITAEDKIKRNEPCPCGSGKKYKKCCGLLKEDEESISSSVS